MQVLKGAAKVLCLLEEMWSIKVNESQYKQCGVTPHLFTRENLLKKILRKDKYWHNQLRKVIWWIHGPQIMQYTMTHLFQFKKLS